MKRAAIFAALLLALPAHAHQMSIAYLDVKETADGFDLSIAVDPHMTPLAAHIDSDGDGVISPAEADAGKTALTAFTLGRVHAHTPAGDCSMESPQVAGVSDLGVWQARAHFACPTPGAQAEIAIDFLAAMPSGFQGIVRIVSSEGVLRQQLLDAQALVIDAREQHAGRQALRYVGLGIWHILSGLDHLAFVLGLVLGARRLRGLVLSLTAFTLAHSLTLALAGLEIFSLPSRVVEPAIALSIAAVAALNLGRSPERLWPRAGFAFACGLIHGLGFADLLQEAHLRGRTLVSALVSFNVGIELGQLAVVIVLYPLIRTMGGRWRRLGDAALCGLGLIWAAWRLAH